LIIVLLGHSNAAAAQDLNPLRPVDASSPRATLQGFIASLDEAYRHMKDLSQSYFASDRLYLIPEERQSQAELVENASKGIEYLNLSDVVPVLKRTVALERIVDFKEILDRIDFPSFDQIPDRDAMVRSAAKKWRLPNTEIDITLVQNGPRAGDYLVSAETVDRLPEFYDRVKTLPYKPGAGRELSDAYRALSSDRAATVYEAFSSSPIGLDRIIPTRWMLQLPAWARTRIAGVAAWQWLGFAFGLLVAALFIFGMIVSHTASPVARRASPVRVGPPY
jgi:MscS family membrane protein